MPRKPRIHYPGAVYHVILRGNADEPVFFQNRDRFKLYLFLQESVERFHYRIHGFCLMTNHIHLILQVTDTPLSQIMQNLSLRYTKWVNFSQNRKGHIFQGRYKALLLDADSYLQELVRYIHLNPVRAKIVALPEQYQWSSHHAYLGKEALPWLTTEWVLSFFGRTLTASRSRYREFVVDGIGEARRCEFHTGTCEGRLLGDDSFVDDALLKSGQEHIPNWDLSDVVIQVSRQNGIRCEELKAPGKARVPSEARALAAVMVLESSHHSLTELGKLLNREVSALSKAAHRLLQQSQQDSKLAMKMDALRDILQNVQKSNLTPMVSGDGDNKKAT